MTNSSSKGKIVVKPFKWEFLSAREEEQRALRGYEVEPFANIIGRHNGEAIKLLSLNKCLSLPEIKSMFNNWFWLDTFTSPTWGPDDYGDQNSACKTQNNNATYGLTFPWYAVSRDAHLSSFEWLRPDSGPKKNQKNYHWTGSRMLEQKFIWSLGLMYFSVYQEHSAKLQRREAEIKVSYWSRLSLSIPTRRNNSIGFFKETCKFQTMQLSANYSTTTIQ